MERLMVMIVMLMVLGCGTSGSPAPEVECNPDTDDCASRGMVFDKTSHACMPEQVCNDGDVYLKIIEGDMTFLSAEPFKVCAPDSPCYEGACCNPVVNCGNKDCGSDGCGGTCGPAALKGECGKGRVCNSDGTCVCLPTMNTKCDGSKVVAIDSCGFTTLKETCEYGCTDAQCNPCPIQCDGKDCGDDGCGGTCGPLNGGCKGAQDICSDVGTCECVPKCGNNECGTDGCGGMCGPLDGDCIEGEGCISGKCKCIPQCSDKVCGPDGCGGWCGSEHGTCEEVGLVGKCLEGQCPGIRLEKTPCPPNALQENGTPLDTDCYKDLWNDDAICTFNRPESAGLCIPIICTADLKPHCYQELCNDKTSVDAVETFAIPKPGMFSVFSKIGYCDGSLYKIGYCDDLGCHANDPTPENTDAWYMMGKGTKIDGAFAATTEDLPEN